MGTSDTNEITTLAAGCSSLSGMLQVKFLPFDAVLLASKANGGEGHRLEKL